MQNKTTAKYHVIPTSMAKIKNLQYQVLTEGRASGILIFCWQKLKIEQPLGEILEFLLTLNIYLPCDQWFYCYIFTQENENLWPQKKTVQEFDYSFVIALN